MSEHEVDLLVTRLREELKPRAGSGAGNGSAEPGTFQWPARAQADRSWAVTADRPFMYRPGAWGRLRGTLLAPLKFVLRKLMRWYVEPAFAQQRDFNSSVLHALDQLSERVDEHVEDISASINRVMTSVEEAAAAAAKAAAEASQRGSVVDASLAQLAARAAEVEERLLRVERRSRASRPDQRRTEATHSEAAEPEAVPDYFAFEARMRGPREVIRSRQAPYVDDFQGHAPVLDIGCGRGEFLELLREAGIDGRGIDVDEDMVEHCRAEGLDVEHADALLYLAEVEDGSLGGIFCAHVVEHLSPGRLFRLLELSAAKLGPDGLFVAETPNPLSLVSLANFTADLSHDKPIHPATLELLARQAGFREAELRFLGDVPEEERLRNVPLPAAREFESAQNALDADVSRLNGVVFGPQDYALLARK